MFNDLYKCDSWRMQLHWIFGLLLNYLNLYSGSTPFDHSHRQPTLVVTIFLKPRLNCDLNFVMKSSRKRQLL